MHMNKGLSQSIVMGFFIVATVFYCGCAHKGQKNDSRHPDGLVFNQPYDRVWDAVHELIFTDLGCVEKKSDKKKGIIETEYAAQITTEGIMRWKVKVELTQQQNGTRVSIEKDVERRDEVDKTSPRYKQKDKDQNPNAGWRNADSDPTSIDGLYQQLENKLR